MANQQILTASNIKYLLILNQLDHDGKGVRCVDVAKALGITKPSAYAMLGTLRDMELIQKDKYGAAFFTDAGRTLAFEYTRYFNALCDGLTDLFSREADIRSAACTLLAELPADSLEDMCRKRKSKGREPSHVSCNS